MRDTLKNRGTATEGDCTEAKTLLQPREKNDVISPENGHHLTKTQFENAAAHRNQTLPLKFRIIRVTLYMLHKLIDLILLPKFVYRTFKKSKKCTNVTEELLKIPVSELTKKIRRKELSCEKVIQSYITRLKEVNPQLNAIIDERFTEAVAEAKLVDELVLTKEFLNNEESIIEKYPLLGVPLTVKGSIAVKGLKHTSGLVTRKNVLAEHDAVVVDLARKAGAIPLVVSNVPELCMNWEAFNKLIGTTKNPYDSTRTCGGSSGGETSLLAAGASLIGIGSDIAGSLRLPAHFCGVWGHKPTPGVVSYEGHYPSCSNHDQWEATFTLGPMARYAKDLRTLLGVISKPEKKKQLGLSEKIDVKKLKIYYTDMENFFWGSPNESCGEALQKVIEYFRKICDTPPQKVDFYQFQYATELATFKLLEIDNVDYIYDINGNGFYSELLRFITFRSKYNFNTVLYGLLKKIDHIIPDKFRLNIRKNLEELRTDFENTLGKNGIFILPTYPVEAIKHGDSMRFILDNGYMSIFNVLGFPVTNCPVSATKEGVPVGVQVAGLPYSDKLTLTVAEEIEDAFGGWRSPNL